jgi:hypothetical protein
MYARLLASLWRSFKVTMRVFWRLTRQLFHEATGAFFVIFSLWAAFAAWKEWRHRPALWLLAFVIAYAILMAGYAVSSFRRARRVR